MADNELDFLPFLGWQHFAAYFFVGQGRFTEYFLRVEEKFTDYVSADRNEINPEE